MGEGLCVGLLEGQPRLMEGLIEIVTTTTTTHHGATHLPHTSGPTSIQCWRRRRRERSVTGISVSFPDFHLYPPMGSLALCRPAPSALTYPHTSFLLFPLPSLTHLLTGPNGARPARVQLAHPDRPGPQGGGGAPHFRPPDVRREDPRETQGRQIVDGRGEGRGRGPPGHDWVHHLAVLHVLPTWELQPVL